MRQRNKLVISVVGIIVLLGIVGTTTMSATTEFVSPTTLEEGSYEDEWVNLEGVSEDVQQEGNTVRFSVTDQNASVPVVYEGTVPETMGEGRIVVAKGAVRDGKLVANQLSVRAHEGSGNGMNKTNTTAGPR